MNASTMFATMAALSIAVERIVEILKQMFGNVPVVRILFTPCVTQSRENIRCACLYALAGVVGGIVAAVSNINILPNANHPRLGYAIVGLLSSGGSSFWNNALDMVQASKIRREQVATTLVKDDVRAPVIGGVTVR